MQVKKNGMKLMKDTASLMNALIESTGLKESLKVGDTFAELQWTDRTLWVVKEVINDKNFFAEEADTKLKDWTKGTEYPVQNEDGTIKTNPYSRMEFVYRYGNWKKYEERYPKDKERVHLSFGEKVGYCDPSF